MKKILILLMVLIASPLYATIYYVSSSDGNDNDSGQTEVLAWASITKVNATTLVAGDQVLFKCGDTFRGMLSLTGSGTTANYIIIGKYGTGDNPRILGSVKSTWSSYSTNVWVCDATVTDPDATDMYGRSGPGGCEVFFESTSGAVTWGIHKTGIAYLTAEYNWYYTGGKVYVYAVTDPDTRYTSIEIPQQSFIIDLNYQNYIDINGVNIFYCGYAGIQFDAADGGWQEKTGLKIQNLELGYIGIKNSEDAYGTQAIYNEMLVKNCKMHDIGRRALSFHLYGGYLVSNIIIEDNEFYNCYHTTGVDISVGNGTGMKIHNTIIRRNSFDDTNNNATNDVHQIFVQNYDYSDLSSTICNLYIYSNVFISPVSASINMEGAQSVYIYNNTFVNHKSTSWAHVWIDANNDTIRIKNNVFYTTSTDDNNGCELFVRAYGRDLTYQTADYNAYYRVSNSLRVVENESSAMYYMNTLSSLQSVLSWELHGYFVNPLFTDLSGGDYTLTSSSTIKTAGQDLDILLDFNGESFDGTNPSIGAFQYGTITVVVPTVTTTSTSNITTTTASSGGNVTSDGNGTVTVKGICWSTSINPTTTDTHTSDGTGEGSFTSSLSGLTASTIYHIRAYATNSAGTGYGSDVEFTTSSPPLVNNYVKYGNDFVIFDDTFIKN